MNDSNPPVGKTPSDVCQCGHTRYIHDPASGCAVAETYVGLTCDCTWFQEAGEL